MHIVKGHFVFVSKKINNAHTIGRVPHRGVVSMGNRNKSYFLDSYFEHSICNCCKQRFEQIYIGCKKRPSPIVMQIFLMSVFGQKCLPDLGLSFFPSVVSVRNDVLAKFAREFFIHLNAICSFLHGIIRAFVYASCERKWCGNKKMKKTAYTSRSPFFIASPHQKKTVIMYGLTD